MKIHCNLDIYESEAFWDIIHTEIMRHKIESKLKFLCKEITRSQLDWHLSHAKFLEKMAKKISNGKYVPLKERKKRKQVTKIV